MNRSCPSCRSDNVRRSFTHVEDVTWRNHFFSRYRCRDCRIQFWVISRKTYVVAAIGASAIALGIIAMIVIDIVFASDTSPPSPQDSESVPEQRGQVATDTLPQPLITPAAERP